MMLTPGTLLGERYEIVEKIGAGGMSIVYKAKDTRLQRFVAIKELREEFAQDEEFVRKFRKEALAAASLSHPNIVGIFDVGSDHDIYYIVMEYIEGHTLKEIIANEGPFNTKTVLEYGIQMVSALKHAHMKKIIHRDIKPQNILITNDHVLKVTDFGIAKAVDSSTIVATGNAIGSVHYFSPEQARGRFVNETSDLYSCGIVLFELATQRLPFEADSHISIALKHINEELPKPSLLNSNVPANLEQIILRATNKSQSERYQNADEMLQDMRGVLQNPNYIVKVPEELEHTILMTSAETEYIRSNAKVEEENVSRVKQNVEPKQEFNTEIEKEDLKNEKTEESSIYASNTGLEEDEEDEEVSTLYKFLVGIGGVLATLTVVIVIALACFLWLPSLGKVKMVSVPNLYGLTLQEAKAEIKRFKLKIADPKEEYTTEVDAGQVFKQVPAAGSTVEKNSTIEITVALGGKQTSSSETVSEEVIQLPDLAGWKTEDAINKLSELGLSSPKIETKNDDKMEMGRVITQTPGYGVKISKDTEVILVVSLGPEVQNKTVKVPNLIGSTTDDATRKLAGLGLELGSQTEEFSTNYSKGTIIDQHISSGTEVDEGTSINIVVSKGEEVIEETPVETPDEEVVPPSEEVAPPSEENTPPSGEEPVDELSTQRHTIYFPEDLDSSQENYHVLVQLRRDDGTSTVIYDQSVPFSSFPIEVELTGQGVAQLDVYFNNNQEYRENIYF